MPYDFDEPVNRRNTHSMKWDVGKQEFKQLGTSRRKIKAGI